jgi:methylase of polypeptide subunit release factors
MCDLLSGFEVGLRHSIDVLVFNPPYVATPSSELGGNSIEASWAGGKAGREVIDKFVPKLEVRTDFLSTFLFLQCVYCLSVCVLSKYSELLVSD